MSDEKQYFDSIKSRDGYIWAVDEIDKTMTPLVISAIGFSEPSSYPSEIVLQQSDGPWWYSRKKYDSLTEIESAASEISAAISSLSQGG